MFAPRTAPFVAAAGVFVVAVWVAAFLRVIEPVTPLYIVAVGFTAVVGFIAVFLRDPDRAPGSGIVSAADGKVRAVETEGDRIRVSVFMNVTDVHVNRFPIAGTVTEIETEGGGFAPAFRPEAAHNLRRRYRLATELGDVDVIQMTGVFARRLVSLVGVGAARGKGEKIGMILFGSRVDVLLPAERVRVTVRTGERVRAGTSTIAEARAA